MWENQNANRTVELLLANIVADSKYFSSEVQCVAYGAGELSEDMDTFSQMLLAPGIATRNKDATRGSWHRY